MFPFAPAPGTISGTRPTTQQSDAPLSDDDRTGLRVLYPDPADTLHQGSISGRIIPANPLAQYIAADLYAGLGDLASLREMPGTADGNREACKWYGKSLELWRQLPLKEGLAPNWFEVVSPRHVAEKQAACTTLPASGKHQD